MTASTMASESHDPSSTTIDTVVYRQLIQQFCESSIERYGIDSDQTRMLKLHLAAHAAHAAQD